MRSLCVIFILMPVMAPAFSLGQGDDVPATRPSSSSEIATLIGQLGDPDFRIRRDASIKLREIGEPALPALKEAAESLNPEVRTRADQIVQSLTVRHVPGRPTGMRRIRTRSISTSFLNGQRSLDINDEGRQIKITEGDTGIEMTVSGETDGKPATETYHAASVQQLQRENPEAYALYERYNNTAGDLNLNGNVFPGGNVFVQGQGGLVLRGGQGNVNVIIQPQLLRGGGDDLNSLRQKLDGEMQKAKLPAEQQQRVRDALDNVDQARQFPVGNPEAQDERIAAYDKACDQLRRTLTDLHLPDPGDALPPPKGARLGISVQEDLVAGGLKVSHVMPDSRADKLGLQVDDLIRKINGKELDDVKELRRAANERRTGLVLDITRDGRELTLREKAAPSK